MKLILSGAALALAATSALAQGQMQGMDHSNMDHGAMAGMMQPTPANPYPPAEMKMHRAMIGAVGRDATETWVRKMLEHPRGALDMYQLVLRHPRDAQVRPNATERSVGRASYRDGVVP